MNIKQAGSNDSSLITSLERSRTFGNCEKGTIESSESGRLLDSHPIAWPDPRTRISRRKNRCRCFSPRLIIGTRGRPIKTASVKTPNVRTACIRSRILRSKIAWIRPPDVRRHCIKTWAIKTGAIQTWAIKMSGIKAAGIKTTAIKTTGSRPRWKQTASAWTRSSHLQSRKEP